MNQHEIGSQERGPSPSIEALLVVLVLLTVLAMVLARVTHAG